ncbi:beta-lactamase/transpeptidase-like protein [Nemania sp. FL0031]|nr:beta-lactamase/transpeptidase-like protein [Nemania sp. FL0031]
MPLMCLPSFPRLFRLSTPLGSNNMLQDVLPQIEVLRAIGGTAGMSIGIMRQGRVVLEHNFGFADIDNNVIASSSTRYPLGSLTKAFVAATIAQLVHDGVLDWDASVTTYIPELSLQADLALADRLTLRDILSHNTGLIRLDALWLGAGNEVMIPKNSTITLCNHLRPVYSLRSKWLYNNWMYALAGEVIERVTNMPWGQALDQIVLQKLGLSQTTVRKSAIPEGSTALPYLVLNDKSLVRTGDLGLTDDELMSSAGGIRSTVHDMLSWGNSLLAPLRGEEGPLFSMDTIFSGQSFMERSAALDELYSMGFAKVVTPTQFGKIGFNPGLVDAMPIIGAGSSHQVFYHNGAIPGYNNCFMIIPSLDVVIVVLTNSISQGDTADWAAQTLLQAVLDTKSSLDLVLLAELAAEKWRTAYEGISNILNAERTPRTDEPYHRDLVGIYSHTTGAIYLEVYEDKENALIFNINGKDSQAHVLSHYHYHTFVFLPSADERIRRGLFHYGPHAWLLSFKKDAQGKVDRVIWRLDDQAKTEGEVFTRKTES